MAQLEEESMDSLFDKLPEDLKKALGKLHNMVEERETMEKFRANVNSIMVDLHKKIQLDFILIVKGAGKVAVSSSVPPNETYRLLKQATDKTENGEFEATSQEIT
jgi:hypothetical protein